MWNKVEFLTNDDTGSCRLSIDSFQECGTALYQVDTLLKISSSEKVLLSPNLYACNSNEGCIVVADGSVSLFDSICQSLQLHFQFDSNVDVVSLCQEGQFLVVGERNGNFHLIHVSSRQILLTNAFVQQSNEDRKIYLNLIIEKDITDRGIYDMFILTNNGLYCIMYLQLAKIQEAIERMDFTAAKELGEQKKVSFISTKDYHTNKCLNLAIGDLKSDIHLIIGGKGDYVLSKWRMDPVTKQIAIQNLVDSSMIQGARKFHILGNLLFVLDEDDVLSMWDVYTLAMVWDCSSIHVEDFLLTTEADSTSSVTRHGDANLKLIVLVTPDNKQMRNLRVYSLPTMSLLYSVEVSNVSTLVQTGIGADTIYLLEEIYEDQQGSPENPSMLVMRSLTEALPENRLSRLLHKRKFDDAEKFAIQFGLDVELVYKVKLNVVLERLASASIGSYGQTVWQELVDESKANLPKIKDDHFVVEYCINAPWPSFEITQEMLNYARARIQKKEDRTLAVPTDEFLLSIIEVLRAQARLTTFHGAFGPEKFSGIAWTEFLNNEDVFKDILFQLEEMNLPCAQYLWLRHQAEFERRFDEKMLDSLLNAIPASIPSKELCLWLKDVLIPFVKRTVPKGQKVVAKWLEHRARSLELTDKANWPENGLEMAEVYFTSKNPSDLGLASSWLWIPLKEDADPEVRQLMKLVISLQELVHLYRTYACRLALNDFEKESTTTIVFRMLDKVLAPELIPSTLEKVIRPYMHQHNLQEEELLLQYIKDLLERCSSHSASLFETAWEAKAMAVLSCMSDTDLMFDAVLQIMYGAVVPWSKAVEQLVKQHLQMNHPKVKLLQESYRLMEMKKLLRDYGIRSFNVSNKKQIMGLVKYILKQDGPSSLEDALKVVKAYILPTMEVYILRVVQLIYEQRGDECLSLLKSLPPTEAEGTMERVVCWAKLALQEHIEFEESKRGQISIAKTFVEILRLLLTSLNEDLLKYELYERNLKMFEAVSSLQEDFDIFLSPEDYENRLLLSELCEKHIKAYERSRSKLGSAQEITHSPNGIAKKAITESRLHRLALLLKVGGQELQAQLALRALSAGKIEKVLQICRDLFDHHCNAQTGHLLFLTAQKLSSMLEANTPMVIPTGMNLHAAIYELSCQAATVCGPDLLLDAQELCKYTHLAVELYRHCQIENYGFIAKNLFSGADRDDYEEWTYEDFFTEDGIVLDPLVVLPVAYDVTVALLPCATDKIIYPLDCLNLGNCSFMKGENQLLPAKTPISMLLQNLQECNQYELALQLIVRSFGTCLLHVVSNSMDLCLSAKIFDEKTLTHSKSFIFNLGEKMVSLVKGTAVALLDKLFNCRVVDHDLALGYCTLLPKKNVFEKLWNVISNTWQNYRKILAVAKVGAHLTNLYDDAEEKQKFQDVITDAEWGIQLSEFGISFQSVFMLPSERKKELIGSLVENPNVNTALILNFCSTFTLDSDAALQQYIETLLLQRAKMKHGEGEPAWDSTWQPDSKLLAKAVAIIPKLQSTQELVISLSGILHKLDPYDYETIEGVLTVIQTADEKNTSIQLKQALGLLNHLKSYKRTSPPVEQEHQYVLEHSISLSSAAQARLPFHLLFFRTAQSFWSIVSAELSEESFPTLLLISKLMKVSLDKLYMTAINNIFEKSLKPKVFKQANSKCSSVITKETAKTVQTIQSYLLSITNPQWAAASAHRIAQELPTGPDKINVLKFCLHLAEQWLKNTLPQDKANENAKTLLKKLRMQYERLATEYVLITHKLNTEEYLSQIGKPANLIISLYQHSSIGQRILKPTGRDYPDIRTAAKQIAELNNLNMTKIRDVLLEKWLCSNTQPVRDKNQEFVGDIQEDEDLRRVIYLLQPYPMDYSSRMLCVIATSAMSPISVNQLTFTHRSRALQCLVHLADTDTMISLIKKPIEEIKYYLKCCVYLAEFEILNIPYTFESFHNSPKDGMIKGLWKNHSHEPRAVRLVTELSLEYQVYDPQLWNGLIQKLLGFNMLQYLRKVLVAITGEHSLWQIPNFSRAWRSIILAPFLSASCPLSPKQLEECYNCFVALLKCPVLADLDLIGIAKQYAQLDLPAFTLGCLLLIPQSEKRQQHIQAFISSCDAETVLQQVIDHMETGEVAGFASQIKDLILDNIFSKKQFEKFMTTKYSTLLKLHAINANQVKDLVEYFVSKNCLDEAAVVIADYQKHCGKPIQYSSSTADILKTFLNGQK
ncbi:kinetochore-associated protein 1 [Rhinatrema bivittatum]|uniref:kinetochore-associated protein 1 n=1 Tax=Rhinatrema bivittatum TaxID=194408 RepID=UPI00112B3DB9|nr:kinetochore-associated protein 1 [Rhinatrema bivittatum]XP_029427319.1 kinetochore-associated protein 1 [Rhinatrema bivittatum]XP_029427320.1 kinetochore-associated protein 1 [Rhinatrema bivittatum]